MTAQVLDSARLVGSGLPRPDRLNAINDALIDDLHRVLKRLEDDASLPAVVLTGAGRGSCAGADLKETRDLAGPAAADFSVTNVKTGSLAVRWG
jgi:2-(1,2-epoxy-1,2-dihydrophenyl)acetyl-CoA isomerase